MQNEINTLIKRKQRHLHAFPRNCIYKKNVSTILMGNKSVGDEKTPREKKERKVKVKHFKEIQNQHEVYWGRT